MKATPLISSTLASAVVFLLMKLAVMAMASFPRNSFLLKPAEKHKRAGWGCRGDEVKWRDTRLMGDVIGVFFHWSNTETFTILPVKPVHKHHTY